MNGAIPYEKSGTANFTQGPSKPATTPGPQPVTTVERKSDEH